MQAGRPAFGLCRQLLGLFLGQRQAADFEQEGDCLLLAEVQFIPGDFGDFAACPQLPQGERRLVPGGEGKADAGWQKAQQLAEEVVHRR
ncbi:MAG: hypothetical protein BWY57_03246 [Betaproteobacteria bacterium ADurb.Bin341]|nr:MAG: hypothetical protein BWY57_03246 [Betaproteobacteria bacterium ADurb.Bin341]